VNFKVQIEMTKTVIQFIECEFAEDAVELARLKTLQEFSDCDIDAISVFDPDEEVGFAPPIVEITHFNTSK